MSLTIYILSDSSENVNTQFQFFVGCNPYNVTIHITANRWRGSREENVEKREKGVEWGNKKIGCGGNGKKKSLREVTIITGVATLFYQIGRHIGKRKWPPSRPNEAVISWLIRTNRLSQRPFCLYYTHRLPFCQGGEIGIYCIKQAGVYPAWQKGNKLKKSDEARISS